MPATLAAPTLAAALVATATCPTCGDAALEVDTTQLPTGADWFRHRETVVISCSCCGFAAENQPDGLKLVQVGVREAGFDKATFRRRMAALVGITPEIVHGAAA